MSRILIIIASFIFLSQSTFAKTDLKFNLKVGESYHQTMNTKTIINQVLSSEEIDLLMSMSGSMTYTVTSKEENIYTMDVVYDSLSMGVSAQGYDMTYNSENPKDTNDYISILLAALRDTKFGITMTERGKIVDISNFEGLFSKAFETIQQLDPIVRKQLEANLRSSFGKENFKSSFETITAIFPPEPVDIGRQWKAESVLNKNMPIRINTLYKFENETDENYIITGVGTLISYKSKEEEYNNQTPYTYQLTGIVGSEIKLDKTTGWIKEARVKQEMNGYSMLKAEIGTENPKKVEMEFKVITTYKD
ncbi:MAG: hypothetical protein CVV25_08280 [Ignavibacteriae bacterium HGW-Ignavibacteriae-4]|jgi:hypothetical protein|nr:MAG: hypothetical protein CVV25_08280 [Ignavibacteriae bacterium HGW-Ignavibacteriae-4]